MIDMLCPHCRTAYRLKPEFAGRQVKCRVCQNSFTVEDSEIPDDQLMSIEMPEVGTKLRTAMSDLPSTQEFSRPMATPLVPVATRAAKPARKGPKVDELGFFVQDEDEHPAARPQKVAIVDHYDEAEMMREAARRGAENLYEPRKPKAKSRSANQGRQGPTAATIMIRLILGIGGISVASTSIYLGIKMLSNVGVRSALSGLPYEIQAEFEQKSDAPLGSPAPASAKIDTTLQVRDLTKHRALLREMTSFFNSLADAIAQVNDEQSAAAMRPRVEELTRQMQDRVRQSGDLRSNPREDQILARELGKPLKAAALRVRDQMRRLQANSQFPAAMSAGIAQMDFGLSQLERQFVEKADIPSFEAYAEIRVAGLKSDAERVYIQDKINELASPRSSRRNTSSMAATRYAIWPVESVSQLARSIDFGKVIRTNGKEIWVVANPITKEELAEKQAKLDAKSKENREKEEKRKQEAEERESERKRNNGEIEIPKGADSLTRGILMVTRSTNTFQRNQGFELLKTTPFGSREGEVLDALSEIIENLGAFEKDAALAILKKCRDPKRIELLHLLLKRQELGDKVVVYLGELKLEESIEPLIEKLNEFGFRKNAVIDALIGYGPSIEPKLIPYLGDSREFVREGICRVLAAIGGEETLKAMKKLPPDRSSSARNAAANTITVIQNRRILSGESPAPKDEPKKYDTTASGKIVISPKKPKPSGDQSGGGKP